MAAKTRIVVNEGGSRSSKTYSIAQKYVIQGLETTGEIFTVCRKTTPALRATAMRDFLGILMENGLYSEENHNKTEKEYKLNGNLFEFIAIDQPQKIRGRKRNKLWINEANELTHEDFKQLAMRTSGQITLDYNPSDEYHWIYDHVLIRKDCTLIHSTYNDNPFIEDSIIQEIENYKNLDPNYWRIYGLGLRGISEAKIYTHWKYCDKIPDNVDEKIYGLDFGFNNPSALMEIGLKDQEVYANQLLCKSHLTNRELIMIMLGWDRMDKLMKEEAEAKGQTKDDFPDLGISFSNPIYADSAEPQRIEEIRQAGFWIEKANKDVEKGIDTLKSAQFYITKTSVDALKEVKSYSWKVKDDKILDEPVKANDHCMDATRYATHTHKDRPFVGIV